MRCNPHPEETASILVFDHPYAAIAAEDGSFDLGDVPSGTHELWVWQDGDARLAQLIEVEAGRAMELSVTAGGP